MLISVKGNSKRTSGNSFVPLGAQNKEFGAALQTLLTEVKLRLHGKSRMGNVKVTWAKRARSVQVSRPSNGNTCGITNKCPLFYLLLTEQPSSYVQIHFLVLFGYDALVSTSLLVDR